MPDRPPEIALTGRIGIGCEIMAKIFLSPYKSEPVNGSAQVGCGKVFAQLRKALQQGSWPYDGGDDPSFFCRNHSGNALTWGVCRADVRGQLEPGDIVVFFSFSPDSTGVVYRLSAVATVERKIQHSSIFLDPAFGAYRKYFNLLVRPNDKQGKEWIHHEPYAAEPHSDWLNRVAIYRKYSKDGLKVQCATGRVRVGQSVGGNPFVFGHNYVLFSPKPEQTLVLKQPRIVAYAEPPRSEEWKRDTLSRVIWERTFGELRKHKPSCQRTLRLDNKTQHPHSPPARWEVVDHSARQWRNEMIGFLLEHDVGRP
jgi:hypothetical protein